MKKRTLIYTVLLVAGGVIGAFASDRLTANDRNRIAAPQTPVTAAPAQLVNGPASDNRAIVDMLDSLSAALTQESEYRLVLEEQIDQLNERVNELQASLGSTSRTTTLPQMREAKLRRERSTGPLTVEKLVATGMSQRDASALKLKLDDIAMQRLYLRDQAIREGWMGDQRYREEAQRLAAAQNNIRTEFGDDNYDRYLYASGRPNRVQVQNVLQNSPAHEAGLRAGDQILSYNSQPTFAPNDLRRATQQGNAGEMIPVQVMRNGNVIDLYVPRGPLGVQMTGVNAKP